MHSRPNPFTYGKPITLDTLDDLFAHHRALTGGWSMEDPPPADPPASDPPPATFEPITSQEDFDRRLGERLGRERAKFADYDELKGKAQKYDEGVEAAKSEHEKAVEEARKEGAQSAATTANARLIKAEARAQAAQAGFRSLSDVALLDLSSVTVNDSGEVDVDAIKAKLKELSDAEPWRITDGSGNPNPRPDHSQGGGGGGGDRPGSVAQVIADRRAARAART